jgi:hypothetical protein
MVGLGGEARILDKCAPKKSRTMVPAKGQPSRDMLDLAGCWCNTMKFVSFSRSRPQHH